jgi:hypothetical protein
MESETFYVVVRGLDGSLVTLTEIPEEGITATRTANTGDVYETAKQIVHEVDTNDLALRVADLVAGHLAPKEAPSIPSRLKDALKERGIDPESIVPTA